MPRFLRVLAGGLLAVATLLVPNVARADTLPADFDGDGVRDRIDVAAPYTELDIRLSKSRVLQRLRTDDLIVRFVVADIDRDGDPDVVANTRRAGLLVWINTGRGRFAPHTSTARALERSAGVGVSGTAPGCDDNDCTDQARQLVAASNPRGEPIFLSRPRVQASHVDQSHFEHSPRIARGPPFDAPRL